MMKMSHLPVASSLLYRQLILHTCSNCTTSKVNDDPQARISSALTGSVKGVSEKIPPDYWVTVPSSQSFYFHFSITECFSASVKWTWEWCERKNLVLPFKGLWEFWVLFSFPLSNSLMPRLLLDHYPNPSPQHGCQASKTAGACIWKQHVFKAFTAGQKGLCTPP